MVLSLMKVYSKELSNAKKFNMGIQNDKIQAKYVYRRHKNKIQKMEV